MLTPRLRPFQSTNGRVNLKHLKGVCLKNTVRLLVLGSLSFASSASFAKSKAAVPAVRCTSERHDIGGDTPDVRVEHDCNLYAVAPGENPLKKIRHCRFTSGLDDSSKMEVIATYSGFEVTHTSITYKKETTGTDGGVVSIIDKDALAKFSVTCTRNRTPADLRMVSAEERANVKVK